MLKYDIAKTATIEVRYRQLRYRPLPQHQMKTGRRSVNSSQGFIIHHDTDRMKQQTWSCTPRYRPAAPMHNHLLLRTHNPKQWIGSDVLRRRSTLPSQALLVAVMPLLVVEEVAPESEEEVHPLRQQEPIPQTPSWHCERQLLPMRNGGH